MLNKETNSVHHVKKGCNIRKVCKQKLIEVDYPCGSHIQQVSFEYSKTSKYGYRMKKII